MVRMSGCVLCTGLIAFTYGWDLPSARFLRFTIMSVIMDIPDYGKTYGPWSAWSPCSATCMEDSQHFPYQRRTRTCEPDCTVGFLESRPCIVPLCQPGMAFLIVENIEIDIFFEMNEDAFRSYSSLSRVLPIGLHQGSLKSASPDDLIPHGTSQSSTWNTDRAALGTLH